MEMKDEKCERYGGNESEILNELKTKNMKIVHKIEAFFTVSMAE